MQDPERKKAIDKRYYLANRTAILRYRKFRRRHLHDHVLAIERASKRRCRGTDGMGTGVRAAAMANQAALYGRPDLAARGVD